MLKNIELCGYEVPTPIQKFTIPAILQGYDVIGVAQTGEYLHIISIIELHYLTYLKALERLLLI